MSDPNPPDTLPNTVGRRGFLKEAAAVAIGSRLNPEFKIIPHQPKWVEDTLIAYFNSPEGISYGRDYLLTQEVNNVALNHSRSLREIPPVLTTTNASVIPDYLKIPEIARARQQLPKPEAIARIIGYLAPQTTKHLELTTNYLSISEEQFYLPKTVPQIRSGTSQYRKLRLAYPDLENKVLGRIQAIKVLETQVQNAIQRLQEINPRWNLDNLPTCNTYLSNLMHALGLGSALSHRVDNQNRPSASITDRELDVQAMATWLTQNAAHYNWINAVALTPTQRQKLLEENHIFIGFTENQGQWHSYAILPTKTSSGTIVPSITQSTENLNQRYPTQVPYRLVEPGEIYQSTIVQEPKWNGDTSYFKGGCLMAHQLT